METGEHLYGEPSDKLQRDAIEIILLNELVEVFSENLESQDQMLAEPERVEMANNTFDVFRVIII